MWTFEFKSMNAPQRLHDLGQSLWLDNITRDLLNQGTLQEYIDYLSVTGLTSNTAIRQGLVRGRSGEELFFDLPIEDLTRADKGSNNGSGT